MAEVVAIVFSLPLPPPQHFYSANNEPPAMDTSEINIFICSEASMTSGKAREKKRCWFSTPNSPIPPFHPYLTTSSVVYLFGAVCYNTSNFYSNWVSLIKEGGEGGVWDDLNFKSRFREIFPTRAKQSCLTNTTYVCRVNFHYLNGAKTMDKLSY